MLFCPQTAPREGESAWQSPHALENILDETLGFETRNDFYALIHENAVTAPHPGHVYA